MERKPKVIRIPFHFDEYRKKNFFLDCTYTINQKVYDAHQIVLSKNSKLYFNYFSQNFTSVVPIPFGENNFNFMIDFFYSGSIHLPFNNPDNLVLYLSMSVIYEVDSLYDIITPIINEFFKSDANIKDVLKLTSQFKNLCLNSNESKLFPNIYNNFERLINEQKHFIPFIIEHYDKITANSMEDLYHSVTPFLLSEILKNKHFSSKKNAKIIDEYSYLTTLTERDKEYLQSVIDWNENDAYLLFNNNNYNIIKMNWVTPDVSRQFYEQILEARSISSQSFLELSQNLSTDYKLNHQINNWWIIQQTQFIQSSKKTSEHSETEALRFIGSIGNQDDPYYNPITFNLINANSSKNLPDDENFGIQEMLSDDPTSYYISYPLEDEINPFIEVSFLKATFDVNRIVVESVPGKMAPKKLIFIFDGFSAEAKMEDYIAELIITNPIKINKVTIRMVDPVSLSLRVKSLKIYGNFNRDVFK